MSDVIIRDKTEYHTRTTDEMERHLSLPPWSLRQKMALACRILAAEGHESALAGQITMRGDRPGTYWMLSFGLGFDEARASNIVLVDDDLRLLEGNGMVNPSNRFHLWIYRHRPNVNAIVHTHPPYCSALSIVGKPGHRFWLQADGESQRTLPAGSTGFRTGGRRAAVAGSRFGARNYGRVYRPPRTSRRRRARAAVDCPLPTARSTTPSPTPCRKARRRSGAGR